MAMVQNTSKLIQGAQPVFVMTHINVQDFHLVEPRVVGEGILFSLQLPVAIKTNKNVERGRAFILFNT